MAFVWELTRETINLPLGCLKVDPADRFDVRLNATGSPGQADKDEEGADEAETRASEAKVRTAAAQRFYMQRENN